MTFYSEGKLQIDSFYVINKSNFTKAKEVFSTLNWKQRDDKTRNILVFINPISGQKNSKRLFKSVLEPMLDFSSIDYEFYETESAQFIQEFFQYVDVVTMPYTDFVVIGGDGVFTQLLNTIMTHKHKNRLIKVPIGIMPGGSQNAIWCDLGGKLPLKAALHIIRGEIVKGDMFE